MGRKTSSKRPPFGQLIAVAATAISVIFLLAFGSQIVEIYRLRGALAGSDTELAGLEEEQVSLEATLTYVQTDEYVERVAREELNKVRPGDQRVVVVTRVAPQPSPAPTTVPEAAPTESSHVQAWWELLFGR